MSPLIHSGATAETPLRAKATVEIESMTKGPPKVTVRVDDDDPDTAAQECLRVYNSTVQSVVYTAPE